MRRAQDAWPLPSFVCSSQKSFGKAAWSRQVTQENWYAPLRQSGSLCKTKSFLSCFQSGASVGPQSRIEKQMIETLEMLQKAARNEFEPNDPPRRRKVRRKSKP